MATREDVVIRFGGDAKGVDATLGKIRASVTGIASGLSSAFGAIGIGVGVGALGAAMVETLNWADDLANTADRVGLTTEAVQALRLEVQHFGVGQQQADDALTKFSVNLGKARQGVGDLAAIFKQYHLSLSGTGDEVLSRYITLLQSVRSEAERNRIAAAGLGKGAIEMAQALGQAGISMDQIIAKQKDRGLIVSDDSVQAIARIEEQYTIALQRMGVAWHSFVGGTVALWDKAWASEAGRFAEWMLTGKAPPRPGVDEQEKPGSVGGKDASLTEVGPTEKFREDLAKRRMAVKSATELELEIWRQYSAEKAALSFGDEEAARKAQEAQEEALTQLAKAGASKAMMRTYEDLVGRMESKPIEIKAKTTVEMVNADTIPGQLQAGIGNQILQITLDVTPKITAADYDGLMLWTSGGDPTEADLPREADKTGANP
jgi:hypothetical protein